MTRIYSVHDIVSFAVTDKTCYPRALDKTRIQFENFQTAQSDECDFSVEIGPFRRKEKDCNVLDDRHFVKGDYFFTKDQRKYAKWQLEVSDIENRPVIKLNTNLAGYCTVPLNVIEFFIHYALLKKGYVLIHASGVKNSDHCYLFPARGGGGKTTIALTLIDKGYQYLGDNFVLLDKGTARSFISPLNIFSYNRLGVVERNLSRKQRLSMKTKELIHSLTGGYIKIFEKINPASIFPEQIINQSQISHIYILEPDSGINGEIAVHPIDTKTLVKKLRYNMELDLLTFSKYMYSYGFINTESLWARYWESYENAIMRNLPRDVAASVLRVPTRYNDKSLEQLLKIIDRR